MAWPIGTVNKIEDVFKKPTEVAQHKTGLKILIWGPEDTRKTGFALSCPAPVYHIDTELGAPPLFQFYPGKDIEWCDATYLNPNTDEPDPFVALQKLETTIGLLKDIGKDRRPEDPIPGTIVIDSGTDVWDWIQGWLEGVGKHTKEGQLLRFEWAKAKQRWRQLLMRLMAKPLHFIMTAQPQDIYVPDGRGGATASGEQRPRLQGASPHVFDIIIHAMKWQSLTGNPPVRSVKFMAEITKCRFSRDFRPTIEDITFEKLATMLKDKVGVEVW